jgi:hypothetical protein
MNFGTFNRVAAVRTDVSENISLVSLVFLRLIKFHSCVALESLMISLSIDEYYLWSTNTVLWDAFMAVPIIDAFWDFTPCSSSSDRRFGEHIAFRPQESYTDRTVVTWRSSVPNFAVRVVSYGQRNGSPLPLI